MVIVSLDRHTFDLHLYGLCYLISLGRPWILYSYMWLLMKDDFNAYFGGIMHGLGIFADNIISLQSAVLGTVDRFKVTIKQTSKLFRNTRFVICMERNRCHNLMKQNFLHVSPYMHACISNQNQIRNFLLYLKNKNLQFYQ